MTRYGYTDEANWRFWVRDADAVLVPDAGDDTLREQLISVLTEQTPTAIYSDGTIKMVADPVADALLPLIREHIAAAVQAERERVLAVSESKELSLLDRADELPEVEDVIRDATRRAERAEAAIERVREAVAMFCHGAQAYAEHGHYCVPILNALDGPEATP